MKRKNCILVLWGMIFFVFLSCASNPEPNETASPPAETPPEPIPAPVETPPMLAAKPFIDPDQGPPDDASLDALNAVIAQVRASRRQAIDFDGPAYAAADWNHAESRYEAGKQAPITTLGEVKDATALYNAASNAYYDIVRVSLLQYYKDRENEIINARTAAINAGIKTVSPVHLLWADRIVAEAVAQYETADYYPAAASAFLAVDMYKVLKTEADVYKVRQEIMNRDFVVYDPNNFDRAAGIMARAVQDYESKRAGSALDSAQEALAGYTSVLETGWGSFAADKGVRASMERQSALDLRAQVAVRKEYDAAHAVYKQADIALKSGKYDEAANLYVQSEAMFVEICKSAEVKLMVAQQAVKTAEQKMAESDENAQRAELILEGGV
ncbi:MAG: hypothetical protein LBT14_03230 [Treponema sp.]|jgi:hypothetical protein|nr:hypothetical protein [Treponema sp.]